MFARGAGGTSNLERLGMFGVHIRGVLDSDVSGMAAFHLTLAKRAEKDLIAADHVGRLLTIKPEITGIIELTGDEFALALALVLCAT